MKSLKNATSELEQVIIKLCELQSVASRCTIEKGIQESDFTSKVSYESRQREKDLRDRLTFLCPDGKNHHVHGMLVTHQEREEFISIL